MIREIDKNTPFEQLKKYVEPFDIVSFDIYDTLLFRNVDKPVEVFSLMNAQASKFFSDGVFSEMRKKAESDARLASRQEDVTLEEIYSHFKALQKEDSLKLMELEKETELSVTSADDLMITLFRYCVESKKTVMIISDMYLPKDFLDNFLRSLGLYGYDLYVSSDIKKTKSSGSLFEMLLNRNRKMKKHWLHVGDNEYSDCVVPAALGINVLHYNNGRSNYFRFIGGIKKAFLIMKIKTKSILR